MSGFLKGDGRDTNRRLRCVLVAGNREIEEGLSQLQDGQKLLIATLGQLKALLTSMVDRL